jgi:hypothetical protein
LADFLTSAAQSASEYGIPKTFKSLGRLNATLNQRPGKKHLAFARIAIEAFDLVCGTRSMTYLTEAALCTGEGHVLKAVFLKEWEAHSSETLRGSRR